MTYEAEGPYFAECERRERTMERHATDPRVAAAHAEMADRCFRSCPQVTAGLPHATVNGL